MRRIIQKSFQESARIKLEFLASHQDVIAAVVRDTVKALREGGKVLFFGNGGSAADAQHLAAEFVNRFIYERPALPAIALSTDTSILTSVSNDRDFSQVFARQVEALGKKRDIVFGISTSGSSPNVLRAIEVAKAMGMKTVGLTGCQGGKLAGMVDHALVVPSRSTPRIQEVHITVGHVICQLVEAQLFPTRSKR
ncbi:MAG: D-sedoheptulose 7-phosphate isomerase [candidate division NC10 bacterium]|nr:D-sedoheptulose 7-phosphate isomerase [candidate division NC10 bacterium]